MSDVKTERQKAALVKVHGPIIGQWTADIHEDGSISVWQSINHDSQYTDIKVGLMKLRKHIDGLLADEQMCPFHPEFKK